MVTEKDGKFINESGQVALKWAISQRNPKPVKIDGTDTVYIFSPKFNVFMAWVDSEHVERLLNHREKTCNCNNGTFRNAFEFANQLDVNLWLFGNREGKPYVKENI